MNDRTKNTKSEHLKSIIPMIFQGTTFIRKLRVHIVKGSSGGIGLRRLGQNSLVVSLYAVAEA